MDSTDASSWDNPQSREFDIAINSQFVPIEAVWSTEGARLFIVFENGRTARLAWDGKKLDGLSWSDADKSIQSTEQQEPWQPDASNRWHVVILSHAQKGSRIEFVSLDPSSKGDFSPILSTSRITSFTTSPNENLLANGDENGTLGVWFAAPS